MFVNCLSCQNYDHCDQLERWDGGCINHKLRPQTNADRIRAMTDEELVNQFTKTMGFCCPVKGVDCSLEPDCRVCFDRWLKQEVTE